MKKIVVTILAILLLMLSACTYSADNEKYTLMIYVCGSNLESSVGAATRNIREMLEANIPSNVEVLIETGGSKEWKRYNIPSTSNNRYAIEEHELKLIESNPAKNMGDADTLSSFLSWGMANYSADRYGLILWDHGGGSIYGVCNDEKYGMDSLTHSEMKDALDSGLGGVKLDFIGFDACLMATIETASTIKPYAGNMIASEEVEPSGGWNYSELLEHIGRETFYDKVLESYASKSSKKNFYTLSHIDLTMLDGVMTRLDALIGKMKDAESRDIIGAVLDATNFGQNSNDYYDLGNIMSAFSDSAPFEGITCANGDLRDNATGLSIYFPLRSKALFDKYATEGFFPKYNKFISDYYAKENKDTIEFISYGDNVDNQLELTLTPESMKNIASVRYALYCYEETEDGERMYCVGTDDDVTIVDNKVRISFRGRWVQFGSKYLYATVIEHGEHNTLFESEVMIDGTMAVVIFSYDHATGAISILGAVPVMKGGGHMFDIPIGSKIKPTKAIIEGELFMLQYLNEDEFVYDETTTIDVATLKDGKYQYTAYVKDIYGNNFTAGTAVVNIKNGEVTIEKIISSKVEYPDW